MLQKHCHLAYISSILPHSKEINYEHIPKRISTFGLHNDFRKVTQKTTDSTIISWMLINSTSQSRSDKEGPSDTNEDDQVISLTSSFNYLWNKDKNTHLWDKFGIMLGWILNPTRTYLDLSYSTRTHMT